MALRAALVIATGQVEQLQSGDALDAAEAHVPSNRTIAPGFAIYVPRYLEIPLGVTIEIGADADIEIG